MMKRYLILALSALMALAGCKGGESEDTTGYLVQKSFSATCPSSSPVLFKHAENVAIFDGVQKRQYSVDGEGSSVLLTGMVSYSSNSYMAFYPYSASLTFSGSEAKTMLRANQIAVEGSFDRSIYAMVANDTDGKSFAFKPIYDIISITLASSSISGHSISSISISSETSVLAGDVVVDYSGTPKAKAGENGSNMVALSANSGSLAAGTYNFVVLPGSGTLNLEFTATDGAKAQLTKNYSNNLGTISSLEWDGESQGGSDSKETTVTTLSAANIASTSATLNGSYSNASAVPTYKGFMWGTSASNLDGDIQSETSLSSTSGNFSVTLPDLSSATTYYYQAYIAVYEDGKYVYYYGAVKSFTTASASGSTSSGAGWFELPVINSRKSGNYLIDSNNSNIYYAYHLCAGGEKSPSGTTARNYTVCYNGEYHCPVWVAAPRHDCYEGSASRTNAYQVDPDIPSSVQQNNKKAGSGYNKGHMLGSAERTSSSATNKQVFYYSNIAPQNSSWFNTGGGGWNTLEDYIDTQVCSDTLYIVIGCYFENYTDAYGNSAKKTSASFMGTTVQIPTMFYYACLRTKKGNSGKSVAKCSANELQAVAFVRAHASGTKGQKVTSTELMSISDLEKITGYTYFTNVPNAPKSSFSSSDWDL